MTALDSLLKRGTLLFLFLLPLQTVWIVQEAVIGAQGAVGIWQYGTLKVYAIEGVIGALACIYGIRLAMRGGVHSAHGIDRRAWYGAIAFFFLAGVSIAWSENALVALVAFGRLLEGTFLFTLFRSATLSMADVQRVWIAAAVLQGILGIWQFAAQGIVENTIVGIAAHDPSALGTAVVQAGDRRWLRAYGAFPHPNIFGAYLAVSMVWCGYALSCAKKKWQWLVLIFSSQIILVALLLTFSRSAWLALIAGGAFCAVVSFRRRPAKEPDSHFMPATFFVHPITAFVLVSSITIAIFSTFFFEEVITRIGAVESRLEVQSVAERISQIDRAQPLLSKIWYRGTGIGNFTNTLFRFEQERGIAQPWYAYQPLHDVPLMIFAELGIGGGIAFLMLIGLLLRTLGRSQLRITSYGLLIMVFTLSLFDHFLWTLPFGIFFAASILGIVSSRTAPS